MNVDKIFFNDLSMVPQYLLLFGGGIVTMVLAVIVHEYGHIWYLQKILKKDIKLRIKRGCIGFKLLAGEQEDYDRLDQNEYVRVNVVGIVMGLFPIIFAALIWEPYFFLVIPYLIGCKKDIGEITKNMVDE